jgi:hypothetical protein
MIGTKEARTARCRNAIVTAAIAAVLLCGGRASAWAASTGTPTPPAAQVSAGTARGSANRGMTPAATTSSPIADQYAQRETSARNLEQFKGGDVIIIGSTGVIVVLLLLLILLAL